MNAIEGPPQMLRLCAACASFMPNARGETADQIRPGWVPWLRFFSGPFVGLSLAYSAPL